MTENQDTDFKGAPTPCHEWFMTANASQNRDSNVNFVKSWVLIKQLLHDH